MSADAVADLERWRSTAELAERFQRQREAEMRAEERRAQMRLRVDYGFVFYEDESEDEYDDDYLVSDKVNWKQEGF
jgi:hypothetical protein